MGDLSSRVRMYRKSYFNAAALAAVSALAERFKKNLHYSYLCDGQCAIRRAIMYWTDLVF